MHEKSELSRVFNKKEIKTMRYRYLYLFIFLLGLGITSCQSDFIDGVEVKVDPKESSSVITMITQRADGVINLSIDAPALDRFGVWIDLNGDGKRAEDGTENVKVFNNYQEYNLAAGVETIAVYGNITYLGAASNDLTSIDVSENNFLNTLNIAQNLLKSIDLSNNTALTKIDVSENDIETLDVSMNRKLESLWVYNNNLLTLDVSNNLQMDFLDCSSNGLTMLDVTANKELARLLAYNNQLTSIDISGNEKLSELWLFGNPFAETEIERLEALFGEKVVGELWIED